MIQHKTIESLQEGKLYTMISHRDGKSFENKVVFISKDYTGLNRKIGYFCFSDRGGKVPTKMVFVNSVTHNKMINHTFALWEWELNGGSTELIRNEP